MKHSSYHDEARGISHDDESRGIEVGQRGSNTRARKYESPKKVRDLPSNEVSR
jgi:hypothetical protein